MQNDSVLTEDDQHHFGLIHEDGTFLCYACLDRKALEYISPDKRYCLDCCRFLTDEAMLSDQRGANWVPTSLKTSLETSAKSTQDTPKMAQKAISGTARLLQNSEGCPDRGTNTPTIMQQHIQCRGRPRKGILDEVEVKRLHDQGLSFRVIAVQLEGRGQKVSFSTLARMVARATRKWHQQ